MIQMIQESDDPALGAAAGSGRCSLLGGENSFPDTKSPRATQAEIVEALSTPLPSFFELVADNCGPHLRGLAVYSETCRLLACVKDYEGFLHSGDKLLDQAREFSKLLKLLKSPSILNNETADRLEGEALGLRERADLLEMEASQIRAAVSP